MLVATWICNLFIELPTYLVHGQVNLVTVQNGNYLIHRVPHPIWRWHLPQPQQMWQQAASTRATVVWGLWEVVVLVLVGSQVVQLRPVSNSTSSLTSWRLVLQWQLQPLTQILCRRRYVTPVKAQDNGFFLLYTSYFSFSFFIRKTEFAEITVLDRWERFDLNSMDSVPCVWANLKCGLFASTWDSYCVFDFALMPCVRCLVCKEPLNVGFLQAHKTRSVSDFALMPCASCLVGKEPLNVGCLQAHKTPTVSVTLHWCHVLGVWLVRSP